MLKQILYVCNIFCIITYTMEPQIPRKLSHQSPEITRIHSQTYLDNLDNNTSETLSKIYNSGSMWWYTNTYSKSYLPPLLDNASIIVAATESVITKDNLSKPQYAIALAEGYSFAGHNCGNKGHVYAPIPIAAAYALNRSNNIQRILILDENITVNTSQYYFEDGNGSIFFPKNNPKISALFEHKIITENQISKDLNDFLYNSHNNIGLAFYNINVDDIEPIEEMHPNDAKERKSKIYSLLYHLIPTIFIFSGDKNTSQDITDSLTTYISQSAEKVAVLSPSYRFNQEWEHHKEKWMTSTEEVMSFLEKKRSTIPMSPYSAEASSFAKASEDRPEGKSPTQSPSFAPSSAESSGGHGKAPEGRPNNSPRKTATSSQSSSSSCNDLEILEYKRKILKKRLELYVSSSSSSKSEDSYDVAETSSSHSKEIEYISNGQ